MKILVINAGSSSLKYQFIDMQGEKVLAKGNCEKIGFADSFVSYKIWKGIKKEIPISLQNHKEAFIVVKDLLLDKEIGVIKNLSEVSAIGHRIVQGGAKFKQSVRVTDKVIKDIESLIPLAPLHNKAQVQAINACLDVFGKGVPEVVVFDTAFHSTMPPKAYMYAVPYEYYEKYHVRKYGFHGTSHKYVSHRCAELMKKDIKDLKIITCHLGNGASAAAIQNGKVVDTSMGFTPLDGFMMGSRSGELDPSIVTFIAAKENMSPKDMDILLNKKSGLLGISGISSDDRDVTIAAENGNERAILAQEMYDYQVAKFVGSYIAAMNGVDAIVFTAGLGENQASHRIGVCNYLKYMSVELDEQQNDQMIHGKEGKISTNASKVDVFVIPTNEEIMIARDTMNLVKM